MDGRRRRACAGLPACGERTVGVVGDSGNTDSSTSAAVDAVSSGGSIVDVSGVMVPVGTTDAGTSQAAAAGGPPLTTGDGSTGKGSVCAVGAALGAHSPCEVHGVEDTSVVAVTGEELAGCAVLGVERAATAAVDPAVVVLLAGRVGVAVDRDAALVATSAFFAGLTGVLLPTGREPGTAFAVRLAGVAAGTTLGAARAVRGRRVVGACAGGVALDVFGCASRREAGDDDAPPCDRLSAWGSDRAMGVADRERSGSASQGGVPG